MNETIRLLREKNNLPQIYVANIIGVSRQMYIKYENGDVEPSLSVVKKLCNLYGVSYETIIDNKLKEPVKYKAPCESFECMVAEPAVEYRPKNALDIAIENLKSLSEDTALYAFNYISYLVANADSPMFKKDGSVLRSLAGKIHLDKKEVERFREESLI